MWSVRELDRNISTQYFERRLAAQLAPNVEDLPAITDKEPLEYIKNPMVAEFMGFHRDAVYSESEMEQALINNLEKFILELGRGFAFVERQQHIVTETSDFYIDLVFYNFHKDKKPNVSSHMGMVTSVEYKKKGYIYVIEGNKSDKVAYRHISYSSASIVGFGKPYYK